MTDLNSSSKLDDFGLIDYKKPLGKEQDWRTSTYLGHKVINDNMLGNKIQATHKETTPYEEDVVLEKQRKTDYKTNYVWKFGNPEEVRNISLNGNILYMKPFYECHLKFLKRPMKPVSSVTHSDYLWQQEVRTSPPISDSIPAAVSCTKIVIDPNKHGSSKYLDPTATTNRLDYCYRSPKDIMNGIAAKDNITFWNWKDIEYRAKKVFRSKDEQLCDQLPSKDCTKRRCEFTNQVRPVPNSGLTTEVRENYIKPNERAVVFDARHIKNDMTFVVSEPSHKGTEYGILGSGESTQKYV